MFSSVHPAFLHRSPMCFVKCPLFGILLMLQLPVPLVARCFGLVPSRRVVRFVCCSFMRGMDGVARFVFAYAVRMTECLSLRRGQLDDDCTTLGGARSCSTCIRASRRRLNSSGLKHICIPRFSSRLAFHAEYLHHFNRYTQPFQIRCTTVRDRYTTDRFMAVSKPVE